MLFLFSFPKNLITKLQKDPASRRGNTTSAVHAPSVLSLCSTQRLRIRSVVSLGLKGLEFNPWLALQKLYPQNSELPFHPYFNVPCYKPSVPGKLANTQPPKCLSHFLFCIFLQAILPTRMVSSDPHTCLSPKLPTSQGPVASYYCPPVRWSWRGVLGIPHWELSTSQSWPLVGCGGNRPRDEHSSGDRKSQICQSHRDVAIGTGLQDPNTTLNQLAFFSLKVFIYIYILCILYM